MTNFRAMAAAVAVVSCACTSPALAGTRAGDKKVIYAAGQARDGHGQGRHDNGPRQGFPDNHGLEQAHEHANEHAAFHHHDKSCGT